jgi:hypothetical protein
VIRLAGRGWVADLSGWLVPRLAGCLADLSAVCWLAGWLPVVASRTGHRPVIIVAVPFASRYGAHRTTGGGHPSLVHGMRLGADAMRCLLMLGGIRVRLRALGVGG